MSVWKLQCHFCGDTVSTGKLNRNYYKMHLEAVHNVQQHGDSLLQWTLSQQSVDENVGSTVSAVANIMSMKVCSRKIIQIKASHNITFRESVFKEVWTVDPPLRSQYLAPSST